MIFNYKNKEKINECINIHDYVFKGFTYNEEDKTLNMCIVNMQNFDEYRKTNLIFYNMIGLDCELCQF